MKITLAQRNYLVERAQGLFGVALQTLNDRSMMKRSAIRQEVLKKIGKPKIEEEARKLLERIEELNRQYAEVFGHNYIDAGYSRTVQYGGNADGNVVARMIGEAMAETPEGGLIARLQALQITVTDMLRLSLDERDPFIVLKEIEAQIAEIVGVPKALPPAPKGGK